MSRTRFVPGLVDRRDFLRGGAAAVAVLSAPGLTLAAKAKKPRKIPIAVQLYSVRKDCAEDMDGTLAKIAAMGFEGVEFAGYHKYAKDAVGLRKKLDALKLKAEATHIGAGSFAPDKIKETIAFHKTIGCKFLIVPGDGRFTDPVKSKEYAKVMTDAAAALKGEGLFCGHHNHTDEFKKEGDTTYWDLFAQRTPKEVILQNDLGWTFKAGQDVVDTIKRYPGRTRSAHMKAKLPKDAPADKKPFVGQDMMDWKSIITALDTVGGVEWFVIEQEDYPDGMAPMDAVKMSFEGLKKVLAGMGRS